MNDLIDSTEMYLRTVWELEEEGIPPIRARLVERLHLSAPAVSETVGRLEGEGLLRLRDDRTIQLTADGRRLAVSVMRKHRLAERLLVDVIGLEWPLVHVEACRWEHVISDDAERRLIEVLDAPTHDAHGNRIPGIGTESAADQRPAFSSLADTATDETTTVVVRRMSEHLQADVEMMRRFHAQGLLPGARAQVRRQDDSTRVAIDGNAILLDDAVADLVYVSPTTEHAAATVTMADASSTA
ncbi:metal-dependent transcriptional regulator [soil metagenome]